MLLYWGWRIYIYLWEVDPFLCDSVPPGLYSSLLTLKANSVTIFYSIMTTSEEPAVDVFKTDF